MTQHPRWGGQGLPGGFALGFSEMLDLRETWPGRCIPGLTESAAHTIEAHASEDLKQRYLPKMVAGEWTGTMCLTEAHSGTDLGLLRTRAEPRRRRQLRDHRHQDLHQLRRARPVAQHRASGARAAHRRARWHARHQPVPGAEAAARRERRARGARTASPVARSSTRWGSTPRRPASCTSTTRRAGSSASRTKASPACSR